jgi:hypothetical protein
MTKHLNRYIERLPGAFVEEEVNGVKKRVRRYSSHSFRSTAATLALKQGEDMRKVQKFLFNHSQAQIRFFADVFWAKASIDPTTLDLWLDTYQAGKDFKRRGIVEVIRS